MQLTFKNPDNSTPIFMVKGGKYNNKIVSTIEKKPDEDTKEIMPFDLNRFIKDNVNKKDRINTREIGELREYLINGKPPDDKRLNKIYFDLIDVFNDRINKDFDINFGDIVQIPRMDTRECLYICGPSGSGKSTYITQYAKQYKKLFKNNPIYIISKIENDKSFDELGKKNIFKIPLNNENFVDDPIKTTDLEDCLIIFDDTDTIIDKKILNGVNALKDDILETGRHQNIYICISSHLINDYKKTRTVLNECHHIVLFPRASSYHSIKYVLSHYLGLSSQEIERIKRLPTRWVTVSKHYPRKVLFQKGAYLL